MPPAVRLRGRLWRMLAPKWAHAPLSGEGAAKRGGRFNPPGIAALYMSGDFVTAIAEYEQDLGIRPGTLCAYQVDLAGIVDLCDPATRLAARVETTDLACAWKHIALVLRQRPPTWTRHPPGRGRRSGTSGPVDARRRRHQPRPLAVER